MLARLSETDVLSTVSSGSIPGAHYYLEIQRLLEAKPDSSITRQDYIQLVHRLQADFLAGVQKNIRMRALASLPANVRMIFSKAHTRSHRLGELYERHLYSRVERREGDTGPRAMTDLLVQPAWDPKGASVKPKFSNWRRRARVPVLLLNTTSLNSGHGWFFTARWMGEPPGVQGAEVDVNQRYRRLYYKAPTAELRSHRLGYAAASSCVPGLFFVHLRKGLGAPPLNWERHEEPVPSVPATETTTDYGIAPDLQERIASLRTDLDSFTEVEAYALMLSGCRMTEWQLGRPQAEHEANGEAGPGVASTSTHHAAPGPSSPSSPSPPWERRARTRGGGTWLCSLMSGRDSSSRSGAWTRCSRSWA
jgi:hypothetical protein